MRLSNLRIEREQKNINEEYFSRIVCDVECGFSESKELYFSVEDKYGDMLTDDVYDAFLVAAIYPAMYHNEPIEIEGNVTKRIYVNVVNYAMAIVKGYRPEYNIVPVSVGGITKAKKNDILHVGTGFSGGVDSFSTLTDWFFNTDDTDYKIDTLFFFHVGQYGNIKNPKTQERAEKRFRLTSDFAKAIGVGAVMMNTNLFDFYLPNWEYDAGVLCRICSVLVFQRALKRYYISNDVTYGEAMLSSSLKVGMAVHTDPYIMPMLSPEGLEIVCEGAQHKRTEKTANIADNPLAQKYLNVCVNTSDNLVEAHNCGYCGKCMRTQMALESIDALDKFSAVFDKRIYKHHAFLYKCRQVLRYNKDAFAKDNIDFARSHGKRVPSKFLARIISVYFFAVRVKNFVFRRLKIK